MKTSPPRAALAAAFILAALIGLAGCRQQATQDLPNRVLDRPTDLALTCARIYCVEDDLPERDGDGNPTNPDYGVVNDGECQPQAGTIDQCSQNSASSCTSLPAYGTPLSDDSVLTATGDYQLFGFIANSERNEIAMFAECANRLIDMNIGTPGYNFMPAGSLPTQIAASDDGCRVISSNVGSCDLTLLGAEGLTGYGLGLELEIDEPSSLVTTLIPSRYDDVDEAWEPLGARPADLIAVPFDLSTAPVDEGEINGDQCDPSERGSVYVSFPTCNLVAEIDVENGHVLQSRQFVSNEDGEIEVIDTGVNPICPVECPSQFGDTVPDDLPEVDPDGPFPQALELLRPIANPLDQAEEALDNRALFVGGLGSDSVFEIRLGADGEWTEDIQSLELQGASGVSRIRVSPPVDFQDTDFKEVVFPKTDDRQFLYVIVGDGSTRVIDRKLEIGEGDPLGVECDTQRDPSAFEQGANEGVDWACFPVSDADNVQRRALVGGPGIRSAGGADVTDWTFVKIREFSKQTNRDKYTLFDQPGVFAVGTTTRGEVVYVMIDQTRVNGLSTVEEATSCVTQRATKEEVCGDKEPPPVRDPKGLMRVDLAPHSLWPDPQVALRSRLPVVRDLPPSRSFPTDYGPSRILAPSVRLIDSAYAGDERRAPLLGNITNTDQLGAGQDLDPLYSEGVVRLSVHDYRAWVQSNWTIDWEGIVVAAQSTGRIACDNPGWEGGTCRVEEADDARLHDSAAKFCDSGVQAGDKLVLLGCAQDSDCGDGRRCLRETAGGGDSTGICISEDAYLDSAADLRVICRDFIRDPCGEARREFTITKAFQDELWIQSMDLPVISTVAPTETPSGDPLPDGFEDDWPEAPLTEVEDRWICAEESPDGGCAVDDDCQELQHDGTLATEAGETGTGEWRCIEERCRRACEGPEECLLRPLPGPTCFGEFVPYQVALRNAFLVHVEGLSGFDRVEADPDTGECVPVSDVENSPLLTSRLPLPPTSGADDPDWNAIPLCPTDSVLPTDPNPCRIPSTSTSNRFHRLAYRGQHVDALRFSNPLFSLVFDLSSLEALTGDVPDYGPSSWPSEFAAFRRSRIPHNYQQKFSLSAGYQPFSDPTVLESRPVTLPMRIVASPEAFVVFIVDGAGPGTSSGIRGQVVRATLTDGDAAVDTTFNGVR